MQNKERQAETAADSSTTVEVPTSAQMPQNQMLVAVLSAIMSAYEWVMEYSFVGRMFDEMIVDIFLPIVKSKKSFNKFGLFTLYVIIVIVSFIFFGFCFLALAAICIILGTIGYSFIGIILLLGLLFIKRDVSKNRN
jgi:hypothetical protein